MKTADMGKAIAPPKADGLVEARTIDAPPADKVNSPMQANDTAKTASGDMVMTKTNVTR